MVNNSIEGGEIMVIDRFLVSVWPSWSMLVGLACFVCVCGFVFVCAVEVVWLGWRLLLDVGGSSMGFGGCEVEVKCVLI